VSSSIDRVTLGIIWERLIAITDELLLSLVRTSFSVTVREAWDAGCVIFDARGRPISQASQSTPAFTGTAFNTINQLLDRFPVDSLNDGDVIMTNDPWIGTGHLPDINVLRPVFCRGRLIGFVMTISHLTDIGGRGHSTANTELFEEGIVLPPMKIYDRGQANATIFELILANVRVPDQVSGDLMANISSTQLGALKLVELIEEYGLGDLQEVADEIIGRSDAAIRRRIRDMPDGVYSHRVSVESLDQPIELVCTVAISGDAVSIDFAGTSRSVAYAVNVPMCYTRSWCAYALKCLTTPELPNNLANVLPLTVTAPEGCILNAKRPAATGGRNTVGWYVVPLLFGALEEAAPDRIQAETGMAVTVLVSGWKKAGHRMHDQYFATGGLGAMDQLDGHQTTPAPTNCASVATEVWEDEANLTVLHRRILPDSGGAGEFRGGAGQEIAMRNDTGRPVKLSLFGLRTEFPARGCHGGLSGARRVFAIDGQTVSAIGEQTLPPGGVLTIREAGGGGFGDPRARPPQRVLEDVLNGFVTIDGALHDYGVAVDLNRASARRIAPPPETHRS
jgi:N-methylhydantoinase B